MIKCVCDKCKDETTKGYDILTIQWDTMNPISKLQTPADKVQVMLCPKCMKNALESFLHFMQKLTNKDNIYINKNNGQEYFFIMEVEDFNNIGAEGFIIFERKDRRFMITKKEFEKDFKKL